MYKKSIFVWMIRSLFNIHKIYRYYRWDFICN